MEQKVLDLAAEALHGWSITEVHDAAGPAVRIDVPDLRIREALQEIHFAQVQGRPEAIQVRRRACVAAIC
ncbi:hypothetical protein [Streptomyces sp. DT203]|uniref:hypothetical protein n=1 Tax=Streptomyces sp. DT203 TaxID=3393424 RepID=UPI003CF3C925